MYTVEYSNSFRHDLKRCAKRGYPIDRLHDAITLLQQTGTLPPQYPRTS